MWSILPKQYLDEYETKYRLLSNYPDQEYILNTTDTHIFFPRLFYYTHPFKYLTLHKDSAFDGVININIESIIEPREYQLPALAHIFKTFETQGYVNGIINAAPGYGKTAISTFITTTLKKKTLIVVDNEKLKEQFIDAYTSFTTLTIDDIGFIQGKKFDTDKVVTITLVQTLISKIKKDLKGNYTKIRDCGFDLVIYDEVHKTSSGPKYALSTLFINTPNIIGLSATPYVRNINKILLDNSIGDILYTAKSYELKPKLFFIKYTSSPDNKIRYMMGILKDYIKRQAVYNKHITNNENYLHVIYKLTKKCQDSGHRIIIMVSSVAQITSIIEYLDTNGITAKALYSKQTVVDKDNDKILVATYKFASHGFDYKELSALILASPYRGSIALIQMIGRILRLSEDKRQPVVFDLMDRNVAFLFENAIIAKTKIFKDEFGDIEIKTLDLN